MQETHKLSDNLAALKEKIETGLEGLSNSKELYEFRSSYLEGKKSKISELMKEMRNLAPEERAGYGKSVNELKEWAIDRFSKMEEKMKQLMPEYSKKKLAKACEILKMISETPNISIDELRIALDVTDRTIARYISELKDKGIIERKGPDNGGKWKIR